MAFNGANLLLLANVGTPQTPQYVAVGSQRDCTIEESSETIDYSSKNSRAQRVGHGRYSSSISLDSLYVPDSQAHKRLKDSMRDGNLILVAREESDVVMETALAKVDSVSETFPDQGESTVSINLTIDGWWTVLVS